jgi:hypothetical protein
MAVYAAGFTVLAASTAFSATYTWSNTAVSTSWSSGSNWVGGVAPANSLTSDVALFNQTSYVNQPDTGTTSISGITIGDGTTSTAALTISGTALSIGSSGITVNANAGATTISAPITLGKFQTWTNNSSNTLAVGSISPTSGSGTTLKLAGTGSFSTSNSDTNGMLGGWAVISTGTNTLGWAHNNGTTISAATTVTGTSPATTDNWAPTAIPTISTNTTVNSLIETTDVKIASGSTLTLTSGGLIAQGANFWMQPSSGTAGGNITSGLASGELFVYTPNSTLTDNRIQQVGITNNGTTPTILVKSGAGMLRLSLNNSGNVNTVSAATNSYTGGTVLNEGTLALYNQSSGGTTANNAAFASNLLGTGTLTINGGNLVKQGAGTNQALTTTNNIVVNGSSVFQAQNAGNWTLSGSVTGSGTIAFSTSAVAGSNPINTTILFTGDLSGFTGTFSQTSSATAATNRMRFGTASTGQTIDLSNGKLALSGVTGNSAGTSVVDMQDSASGTFKVGELSGTGGILRSGFAATAAMTLQAGNLNSNAIYAGTLADDNTTSRTNGLTALEKVGTGVLVLSKADGNAQTATGTTQSNGYSGGTTVTGGKLLVTNTSGSGTGGGAVTVGASGTLGGSGIINPNSGTAAGTLNTAAGITVSGVLSPGGSVSATTGGTFSNTIGTLTFNLGNTTGNLTLNSGATLSFDLGASLTSDNISIVSGAAGDVVFNNNVINLSNLSGGTLSNGAYTLFTADAAVYSGLTVDGSNFITSGLSVATFSGYTSTLQLSGNNIVLNLTAVPEPHEFALAIVGLLGVLVFIRRRNQQA